MAGRARDDADLLPLWPRGPALSAAVSPLRRALARPAAGGLAAAVLAWLFFAVVAGAAFRGSGGAAAILNATAPLGILAVAVALLMTAGEFDLSVGSVVGFASMTLMLLVHRLGWGVWPAIGVTLAACLAIGALNGWLVVRTRVPSFLVTLGSLFVFRGLAIGLTRRLTGRTQLGGLEDAPGFESARAVFAFDWGPIRGGALVWWLLAIALGGWLLARTRFGNHALAAGGAPAAARAAGVPVGSVKVRLFMGTAFAAGLVAVLQAVRFGGADALRGELQEFRAIAAAVIGGTLLTGGHGSAVGAALGALVFGIVQQGIVMTGIDADWFQVFLGAVLLGAVLFHDWARRAALSAW